MDNEDPALPEMVKMLHEARYEIRAICEVLIDRGVATLEEIDAQIEMAKLEDEYDLKEEAARRAAKRG